jgi:FkbM family methyltransferase
VLAEDPFVAQNPDVGLLQHLYSFLSDTNAIDVGANVGELSERLLDSGYTVYAFEPYPPAFEKLNERLTGVPSFHSFNFAIGSHDATMNLHIAADMSGKRDSTLYHSLVEHPLLAVIRGMGTPRFSVVVAEFWDGQHPFGRSGHGKLDDILSALKQRGYSWHIRPADGRSFRGSPAHNRTARR